MLEIAANGHAGFAARSHAWLQRDALRSLLLPGVIHADIYSPVAGGAVDPFVGPAAGPLIVAIAHFRTQDELRTAISSDALDHWLRGKPAELTLTATPMSGKAYAVDEPQTDLRRPAFRYVVRYHGPREEAARFADQYERTHPPLLAKLPRIRAIECYRPLAALRTPRCEPADYLIGNEVEFDSAEDLNAAMTSPARVALRTDFDALPRVFRGNTHVAMRRERHHAPI
ncbi:EthD family reductase [Bradyrhizobium sp.]|uniref:EthD family reductase n=1 Tax=Bradyrhizobium sp. TaxID=376 RepID=UPI004037EE15